MRGIMKSLCQKYSLDLISFLICYQFIGKMGVKERVHSIGKIQMWHTQTFKQCSFFNK